MYNGPEIYRRMHAFPATTQSMTDAHSVMTELGQIHQSVVDAFKKAQCVISDGWHGGAADAASSGLNPHIQAAGVVSEQLAHSATSLTEQAQAFHKAARPLVEMDDEPPGTWGIGDILSLGASDDEIKAAQWETDNTFNISQYSGYEQAGAANNVPAQQVFLSPPENFVGMASTAVMQSHGGGAFEPLANPKSGRSAVTSTTPAAMSTTPVNHVAEPSVGADGTAAFPGVPNPVHNDASDTTRTSSSAVEPTSLGVGANSGAFPEFSPGVANTGSGSAGVPGSGIGSLGSPQSESERELGGGRRTAGLPPRGAVPGNTSLANAEAVRGSSASNAMGPGAGASAREEDREHKKKVMIFADDPESLFGGSEETATVPVIGLSATKPEKSRFRNSGDS